MPTYDYAGNPYVVVGAPNYAAPLVDFSALDPTKNQQQKSQQQQQPNPQQPNNSQNWLAQLQSFLSPNSGGQQPNQVPGQPLQITPGSVQGANDMLSGLY